MVMPGTLDFSVVIVSWNVRKLLQDCLESIYRLPAAEQPRAVFVVDNASNDGTVQMVQTNFPQVQLIANQENRGYAAANNQALAQIPNGDVLLLNPDTLVHAGAFPRMLQAFADHPKAGIVGSKLLNVDGSVQPSVRQLPTVSALAAIALKFQHFWPGFPPLAKYMARGLDTEREQAVGQVMGAAFLIRRSVISQIGLLDEGFHVWFEEVDFCKRAADADWETWYVPTAHVTHVGGQSFAQQPSVLKQRTWYQSVMHYSRKHFSFFSRAILWKCGRIGIAATWIAAFLQRHIIVSLAVLPVLLTLLTGIASSQVGLLSDDWDWYYEGRMTQQELTRPFTHNVGGAFYRPLATYSYALDYAVAPYSIPVARTQHTILLAATVVLLVVLVWQLTRQAWVASAAGVFFSLWPQHHEVTTWLGSRPDLLSLLWILVSLVTFVAALRRRSLGLFALTVLWSAPAILSKETGVLVLPALVLVAFTLRRLRDWRVWTTLLASSFVIGFFLYVRSLVLGQLIGGYGEAQTQVGVADLGKLFLSIGEGWLNWSWLSAEFPANVIRFVRYGVVGLLGFALLAGFIARWRVFLGQRRVFALLVVWFGLAVSISLPLLQSVSPMNLNGTRYLYFASAVLAVGLAWYASLLKSRRSVAVFVALFLGCAWFVNLQPWRAASAENQHILTQVQAHVPNPPPNAIVSVRGLPGDRFGAFQWYARRSLPEAMAATYSRPDLYAPTALEASPYCNQQPHGVVVEFSYTRATGTVGYLGTNAILPQPVPTKSAGARTTLSSPVQGTYLVSADTASWRGYRGLVVTLEATKAGYTALQLRGEGSTLYNRTVVRVQPGRNDIFFSLCNMRVWVNNPPQHAVRVITPTVNTVTAVHLVSPYAL